MMSKRLLFEACANRQRQRDPVAQDLAVDGHDLAADIHLLVPGQQ